MADLRLYTECTLQPCMESYGLTPVTVSAVTNKGNPITLELAGGVGPSPSSEAGRTEDKAANVLFLLDQYGVADAFYHELAQVTDLKLGQTHM